MSNLLTGVFHAPWCHSAQWVSASAWTGTGSFVSNVCAIQFWWFVEYVFRYLFSRPCTSKNKEEGCSSVPQLPPPGVVADKPVMAQPASDEPASPEGGADDGAFCVGSGLSESRHTCPRDRSSTHDLPACAHHSPPLCMRDTRPQVHHQVRAARLAGRCRRRVRADCRCPAARRLLVCPAEARSVALCQLRRARRRSPVCCEWPYGSATTPRRLGGLPPQAAPPASHLCVRELPHLPPHHRRAQRGPRRRRAYLSDAATIQAATHLPPLPPHQPPPPPPPPRRRACSSLRRRRARRRRRSRRRPRRCGP